MHIRIARAGVMFTLLAAAPVSAPASDISTDDTRISFSGPDSNRDYTGLFPETAYNAVDDVTLVVWQADTDEGALVEGHFECWGRLLDGSGQPTAPQFRISFTGNDDDPTRDVGNCNVTWNSTDNRFLVVWHGDGPVNDRNEIWAQLLAGTDGSAIGSAVKLSEHGLPNNPSYDGLAPRAVWNPVAAEYLVVWYGAPVFNQFEIYGQRTDRDLNSVGADDFRISDAGPDGDTNIAARFPDVVWNSIRNEYLVVWEADEDLNEDYEVFGQRLSATGAEIGTNDFRISLAGVQGVAGYYSWRPVVDHDPVNDRYLVVWESLDDLGTGTREFEIKGQLLDALGAEIGSDDFRISTAGPDGDNGYSARTADLAWMPDQEGWLVVWEADADRPPAMYRDEVEIFGVLLDPDAAPMSAETRLTHQGPDFDTSISANGAAIACPEVGPSCVLAHNGRDVGPGLAPDKPEVYAQRIPTDEMVDSDGDGVADAGDCAPADPAILPGNDADGDRLDDCDEVTGGTDPTSADSDLDGAADDADCAPLDAAIHPGALELECNGVDEDCDGADLAPDDDGDGVCDVLDACPGFDDVQDADADGTPNGCDECPLDPSGAADGDGDGVCDASDQCLGHDAIGDADGDSICDDLDLCVGDDASGDRDGDGLCDDTDPCVDDNPDDIDGDGVCDSLDLCVGDDASGDADSDGICDSDDLCAGDDASGDVDGDGFCALDTDGVTPMDCDDTNATVFPGAVERCDGIDNSCAGAAPAEDLDSDGDGLSICAGDCDDAEAARFPGNPEVCDGLDNDCDAAVPVDERDVDDDGALGCDTDCDDRNPLTFGGAAEQCDGVDNDCDGLLPDNETDGDGDGDLPCLGDCNDSDKAVQPDWPEICGDGLDNDCNGEIDEDCAAGDGCSLGATPSSGAGMLLPLPALLPVMRRKDRA